MKKIRSKNEGARLFTTLCQFFRRSRAGNSVVSGRIWSNFEVIQDIIVVLVTCKNEGTRLFTTLNINFSDAQGQINLESVVVSGQNLNSSKLSCMSLLAARMKMIQSKMKELERSHFSHYKSIGIFPDAQGQQTMQSLVRSGRISDSFEMS